MALGVEEEILGFKVTMSDALGMQVRNAIEHLLEAALDFAGRHPAFLDCRIQVTSRTKLHHLAPMLVLILYEIHGLYDVDMV
jgi:hypothetical protein